MVDRGEVGLDGTRQVTFHDLHVVDVVLQEQVVAAHFGLDFQGLLGGVQVEAGDVAGVDHFHDQLDPGGFQLVGGILEVVDEGLAYVGALRALWANAGQGVDLGVAQHLGVFDGLVDTRAEFLDAVRVAGDTALTFGPVAGRQVEQHLGQAVGLQLLLDFS
ncbi:hypothetical protein D9M71_402990 [compost metagenome]